MNDVTIRLSGTLTVFVICALVLLGIIALTLLDIRQRIVARQAAHRTAELGDGEPDSGPW